MTLRAGELVLGRFEITGTLPPLGDLLRYTARDTATGQGAEVRQPAPQARLRPGARERFHAAMRSLPPLDAAAPPLSAGEHQGTPVSAHAPARPFPASVRLSPEDVRDLAAWLLPAARQAEAALGGTLRADDLVVGPDGVVRLQPTGILPHRSEAVPDPFVPANPEHGTLYGLGVVLFTAATGEPPFSARTPRDLARQQQHPPRPRAVRPELPEALDDLIAGLLSPAPATRLAAAQRIPPALQPPHLALPPEQEALPPASSSTPVSTTGPLTPSSVPLAARRDRALAEWVVVADVAGAPETLVRRLAALIEVPEAALLEAARQGLPVPVAGGSTENAARAEEERLALAGVTLTVERAARRSGGLMLTGGAAGLAGLLAGLLAAGGMLAGYPLIALLLGVLAAASLVVGLGAVVGAGLRSGVPRALAAGHQLLSTPPSTAPTPLEQELAAARRALLQSELPEPARVDLLTAVDDLQAALPDVAGEAEVQRIRQAVADITAAAQGARAGGGSGARSAAEAAADASQKARAAQIAARELRR